MANKKSIPLKAVEDKSIIQKVGEQMGSLAGELVARKDHLVDMAAEAIDSVKSKIQNITTKKNNPAKKVVKTTVKKQNSSAAATAAKKAVKSAASKKISASKQTIKKVARKAIKKK